MIYSYSGNAYFQTSKNFQRDAKFTLLQKITKPATTNRAVKDYYKKIRKSLS